jgi:uncharacterized membrane protein
MSLIKTNQISASYERARRRRLLSRFGVCCLDTGAFCAFVVTLLYLGYFVVAGWLKAEHFVLGMRDTAIYQTALWQAGQFWNPVTYVMPGIVSQPFVGGHFMPIGFVYGLIYRFFSSMQTTVMIYAVSFAVSGWFIFLFARTLAKNDAMAVGAQILYLAVFTPALSHFYFEDWAAPYIAAGLYFTVKRRYGWATLTWLAAMMFKEYIGLAVAAFGVVTWLLARLELRKGAGDRAAENLRARFALLWLGLGVVWFVVAFWGIMRFFQPDWVNQGMFSQLGDSDAGVIGALFTNPAQILARVISPLGLTYLAGLFLPLALLPFIGIEYVVAIVPILFINFLSDDGHAITNGVNGHYTTMIQPFLVAGAVVGFIRLRHWLGRSPFLWRLALATTLLFTVFFAANGIRYHAYKFRESLVLAHVLQQHTQDVNFILTQIEPDASVAADENLLPFLSQRRVVTHLQNVPRDTPTYCSLAKMIL